MPTDRGTTASCRKIHDSYEQQRKALWEPVERLAAFEREAPNERFRATQGYRRSQLLAALGAGSLILPPADETLKGMFRTDCSSCFTKHYANTYVRPANEFLGRSSAELAPAGSVRDVSQHFSSINNAVLRYLETFIDRQSQGGGRGGLQRPYNAANANNWPRFAAAIRGWKLTSEVVATGSANGLTLEMLQEFVTKNDRLRPLLDKFQAATKPRAPVRISPDLERTVEAYRGTLAVLEDDPLKAWRQLARAEDGASLEDFHAFSRNSRLRRNDFNRWMVTSVEEHGAKLLSDAIRPDFERDAERLWEYLDRCCRGRFPFITERELLERRRAYENGYAAAGSNGDLWRASERDPRNQISTLRIELPTASREDLDQIFFAGGDSDKLFADYALDAMLGTDGEGKPLTSVDFLSPYRGRFATLRQWQAFLYDSSDDRRGAQRVLATDQVFVLRHLEEKKTADRVYVGERVGRLSLFNRETVIRPSTDARTGRRLDVPLRFDEAPLFITGTNEDEGTGWNGRLEIPGRPPQAAVFHSAIARRIPSRPPGVDRAHRDP